MGKYLDIIDEVKNKTIDQLLADAAREALQISLTSSGCIRLFHEGNDDTVLKKYEPLIQANAEAIIDRLKQGNGREIVIGNIDSCAACGALQIPPVHAQIAKLKDFQRGRSEYWWWTDQQLDRLRAAMEREQGCLIVEIYAHSVSLKLRNETLRNYPRTES